MGNHHKTKEEVIREHAEIHAAQRRPELFSVLYDRYFKVIYVFVYRRVGDSDLSGDLTSGVFLKAMMGLKKYKPGPVPFSAWLFRIAINEINLYFRKSKRVQHVTLNEAVAVSMIREVEEDEADDGIRQCLLQALGELNGEDSSILEMRFFEGMSFREIGEVLGLKEAAAKVRTYRILEKVKKTITLKKNHGISG